MKILNLPIECKCVIHETKNGYYEIKLKDLPHPCEKEAEHMVTYSGKTIEEMCSNMGRYFSEYLKKEVSDFLGPDTGHVFVP